MLIKHPILLAAILPATIACSAGPSGNPVASPSSRPGIAQESAPAVGSSWRIVSFDGDAALGGAQAVINFRSNGTGASAGCNGIGSDAVIVGSRLPAGAGIGTQMYCEPAALMAQETAIGRLFQAGGRIEPLDNGQFSLTGGGHRLVIAPQSLTDSAWMLRQAGRQQIDDAAEAVIRFNGARMSGSVGCNRLTGAAIISGNRISVPELASTRMACPAPLGERELAFGQMLRSGATISFDGNGWLWLEGNGQRFGFTPARD